MRGVRQGFVPWPDDSARQWEHVGVWTGHSIWNDVRDVLDASSAKVGVIDAVRGWRFGDILAGAEAVSARLTALGLQPDDAVVLQVPNRAELLIGWLGCLCAGVVPVMALPMHRAREIAHFVELTGARAHLVVGDAPFDYAAFSAELSARFPNLETVILDAPDLAPTEGPSGRATAAERHGSDLAHLMVSGGSTGLPKLICRTHNDYAYNARCFIELMKLDEGTVTLVQSPAAHNAAMALLVLPSLLVGARIVLAPSSRSDDTLPMIEREQPDYTVALPATVAVWNALDERDRAKLSTFRIILSGAYRLPPEVGHRAHELGLNVMHGYGMAEGFCAFSAPDDPVDVKCETVGRPISPLDVVQVADEDTGAIRPPGEPGELQVQGPYTTRGYYHNPEANAAAFSADGFFRTGDRGFIREDGCIVVLGRIGEVINRGGEKISPSEVEDMLVKHPAIAAIVVVPVPDERLGQRAAAVVIPAAGAAPDLDDVTGFLAEEGVARFKHPEHLHLVDEFPISTAGKVDRKSLSEALVERSHAQ